ncbi:MAG: outer membrane lipoprotein-sorting protein, partial [Candidatus Desantisbacteria bacterium]
TAKEIMTKTHLTFFYAGDDMKTMVSMALINKDGKTRQRELVMLRKNIAKGGEQKYFMYFYKPDDVRRTTFMVWKYPVRDDNRWIFIPAVNMVRRIAASDSRSSFVGSDFTYEDLSGRELEADTHTLLHEKKLDDKPCYVIQSVPKTKLDYIRKISWIDKETFLPLKEEYYDLQDKLSRVFTSDKIEKIIVQKEPEEYFWTITNRTMKNIKTGHRTEVTFKKIEYNLGIEDNLFTESNLKEPPNKWIK